MSNALGRDLAKLVAAVDAAASECGHGAYGQRFHIMPPAGWLNDPNGLCQAGGVFHAYFQYAPFDVEGGVKVWGHATSRDLMTWDYVGAPLLPDEPFDCHGVYSGSALAEDGRIRVLYTGNVKLPMLTVRTITSIPAAAPIPSMWRALMALPVGSSTKSAWCWRPRIIPRI